MLMVIRKRQTRQQKLIELRMQWRRMAIAIAKRQPSWTTLQVAAAIQRCRAGRKWGGPLTYSVDHISKHIRDFLPLTAQRSRRVA